MQLSLGPVLYYWSREELMDFYARASEWPVSRIYLGETVCSKRRSLRSSDWIELGRDLAAAGKEVVLSSLALVESGSELASLRKLCENGELLVEANDMGAVHLLADASVPFVAGHSVNLYNARGLKLLRKLGMQRWVPPVELGRDAIRDVLAALRAEGVDDLEVEIFALGRMPLAYSARCFTARAHKLPKDDCQYKCLDYPDGLVMNSQEGETFLAMNGIQTQSGHTLNLLGQWREMADLGVDCLRLSPQSQHMDQIVEIADGLLRGEGEAVAIDPLLASAPCDGYWFGEAGMQRMASVA